MKTCTVLYGAIDCLTNAERLANETWASRHGVLRPSKNGVDNESKNSKFKSKTSLRETLPFDFNFKTNLIKIQRINSF